MITDDEQARDLNAFGPLDDVDDRRVDEDQRDQHEPLRPLGTASVTAIAAEVISTSTPVA